METAKLFRQKKNETLDNWLDIVLTEIPEAGNYEKTAIQNSVPDLINAVADVLESNNTSTVVLTVSIMDWKGHSKKSIH